jgi:hypothetical protein
MSHSPNQNMDHYLNHVTLAESEYGPLSEPHHSRRIRIWTTIWTTSHSPNQNMDHYLNHVTLAESEYGPVSEPHSTRQIRIKQQVGVKTKIKMLQSGHGPLLKSKLFYHFCHPFTYIIKLLMLSFPRAFRLYLTLLIDLSSYVHHTCKVCCHIFLSFQVPITFCSWSIIRTMKRSLSASECETRCCVLQEGHGLRVLKTSAEVSNERLQTVKWSSL